jgi:hypothetical protein
MSHNTTGNYNTAIGYDAQGLISGVNGLFNTTCIGYGAKVIESNQVRIGNTEVTSIGGEVSWSTLSDGRFKNDFKKMFPVLSL